MQLTCTSRYFVCMRVLVFRHFSYLLLISLCALHFLFVYFVCQYYLCMCTGYVFCGSLVMMCCTVHAYEGQNSLNQTCLSICCLSTAMYAFYWDRTSVQCCIRSSLDVCWTSWCPGTQRNTAQFLCNDKAVAQSHRFKASHPRAPFEHTSLPSCVMWQDMLDTFN